MNSFRPLLSSIALAALAATGCGPDGNGNGTPECEANLLVGDLVITEVMGNPAGEDEGKEWFEFYNATSGTIDVVGLQLFSAKEDGSSERVHSMTEAILDPGDYFVVGGVLNEFKPGYMDYGYASDLGSLNNTAGKLGLRCGTTLVDEVIYGTMDSGQAQGLDGNSTPDHTANDNLQNWCESSNEFETDQFGTPGMANDACAGVQPTTCLDGGTERAVVAPEVNDLVITEVFANAAGADDGKEWFEVLVLEDVDINGLNYGTTVGDPKGAVSDANCVRVTNGTYLIFAGNADMTMNGGLPRVDGTFTGNLGNSNGNLFVGVGATVLDQVTWTNAPDNKSRGLDPSKNNPTDNDDTNFWCTPGSANTYGTDGAEGTPGAMNPDCDIPPPAGMCFDGGTPRNVVKPTAAQITITEIMPDPQNSNDSTGEYFEIRVDADVDLNGLQIGRTFPTVDVTFNPSACARVTSGTYVVFARSDVSADNGMIPMVTGTFGFGLVNGGGSIFVGMDDAMLDSATWTTADTGNSFALNETTMAWCTTNDTEVFGAGDHGTPNGINTVANLNCP